MGTRPPRLTIDGLSAFTDIAGKRWRYAASDYSAVEDSTPIDPSDTSGGAGQIGLSIAPTPDGKQLRGKTVRLTDGAQGSTTGRISAASGGTANPTAVTADSRLIALNVVRVANPYTGTLAGAFSYYLGLVGITTAVSVDASLGGTPVVFPGWKAVVWDQVKRLCAVYRVEVSLVSDVVVVRPVRQRVTQDYRDADVSWSVDDTDISQSVEVFYYQSKSQASGLVYPAGGWTKDVTIYQVNAGEIATIDIPLQPESGGEGAGCSVTSIVQPTCVDSVGPGDSTASVYTVVGNDGLPVTAAQWLARGGSLKVDIGEDTRSLTLTITGADDKQYSPYRIAMGAGDSSFYSSLRIIGTGVFFDKKKITLGTGNSQDVAPNEVGATVDSEFVTGLGDALSAGLSALCSATGPKQTLTVKTKGVNRQGDDGSFAYPSAADWNAKFAGWTATTFNTAYAGKTGADLDSAMIALVQGRFENQAFGNIAGARRFHDGCWYRVRSATVTPGGVTYQAERDTIASDWNAWYAGMTAAQFNAVAAGLTAYQFNVKPLVK